MRVGHAVLALVLAGCAAPRGPRSGVVERRAADAAGDDEELRLDDDAPPERGAAERLVEEGRAARARGDHAAAWDAFERARAADPGYGLAHLEGAVTGQFIGVASDEIERRFARAAALLENNPRVCFERAAFEESRGDLVLAVAQYRCALELRPSLVEPRLGMARALDKQGEHDAARESYRLVIEAEPKNVAALLGYAAVCERVGDGAAAERALRSVVRAHPDVAAHRQRLIAYLERSGQAKEAAYEKRLLEKLEPKSTRRLRGLKPSRRRR